MPVDPTELRAALQDPVIRQLHEMMLKTVAATLAVLEFKFAIVAPPLDQETTEEIMSLALWRDSDV